MEKASGVKVTENQSNFEESVVMNGLIQAAVEEGMVSQENKKSTNEESKISLESIQDSLSNQKVLNKELLTEIGNMRRRFAGTIKMMKDDLFHLIEEKNLLQLRETQNQERAKCLMSQTVSEIEQMKKQNQESMADQQATIQEQHTIIQELRAQLDAHKVEMKIETPCVPETPSCTKESDNKDKVDSDLPIKAKISDESIPRSIKRKKRNIFYRAAHRVSKRVRKFAMFPSILHQYMFFLFVFMTERF